MYGFSCKGELLSKAHFRPNFDAKSKKVSKRLSKSLQIENERHCCVRYVLGSPKIGTGTSETAKISPKNAIFESSKIIKNPRFWTRCALDSTSPIQHLSQAPRPQSQGLQASPRPTRTHHAPTTPRTQSTKLPASQPVKAA